MRGSDGTAAKLRDDRAAAARGTIAAALAYKLAVVVSGVAVGRQAAAGTRAGGGVREHAPPPGFQESDVDDWPERHGEPARPCPSVPGITRRLTARRCSTLKYI